MGTVEECGVKEDFAAWLGVRIMIALFVLVCGLYAAHVLIK